MITKSWTVQRTEKLEGLPLAKKKFNRYSWVYMIASITCHGFNRVMHLSIFIVWYLEGTVSPALYITGKAGKTGWRCYIYGVLDFFTHSALVPYSGVSQMLNTSLAMLDILLIGHIYTLVKYFLQISLSGEGNDFSFRGIYKESSRRHTNI